MVTLGGDGDDGDATAVRTTTSPATTPPASPSRTSKPSKSPKPAKSPRHSATPTATAQSKKRSSPTAAAPAPAPAAGGPAPLAGRIRPGRTYDGIATFYDAGDGDGACLFGPAGTTLTAAMNTADYETSKACGAYIRVRASSGKSITVRVTNECPAPCKPGQLDLSAEAFAQLAAPVQGQTAITWSLVSPAVSTNVALRYKTGSSVHWCAIQAIGHRNPVARLEVRTSGGGWRGLSRTSYNYFLSEDGAGCGGAIRLTDIYGQQLTFTGIALRPDAVQRTAAQFARHA
ncbi:hypothetical protein J3486_25900 [Streptomyces sp. VRA16 Mangrove soil]|nr:hypothetical protein [Streptomyces sp. VRA16 Mangrove soil]